MWEIYKISFSEHSIVHYRISWDPPFKIYFTFNFAYIYISAWVDLTCEWRCLWIQKVERVLLKLLVVFVPYENVVKLSLGFSKRCTQSQLLSNLSNLTCAYPPSVSWVLTHRFVTGTYSGIFFSVIICKPLN